MERLGPTTYGYRGYALQKVDSQFWVAFDADGNEVYVRTSRKGLVDMIDNQEGAS